MTNARHAAPGPLEPSWHWEASESTRQMLWELQRSILLKTGGQLDEV